MPIKTVKFATFNVRGIAKPSTKTFSDEDCKKYKCPLEGTEATKEEWTSRNGYKYVQKRSHYGILWLQ